MGWLGLHEHVEPVIRRAVCARFGRAWEDVGASLVLRDDLGATPLDMAELAVEIDRTLGVTLPMPVLARAETVGDLVDLSLRALALRTGWPCEEPLVRVRFTSASRGGASFVERVGRSTPYFAEEMADDVRLLGEAGRIDVFAPPETPWTALARVCERLGAHGARVAVHRSATPALSSS
jgi:acyl carrier protein